MVFYLEQFFILKVLCIYQNNDSENEFYPIANIVNRDYKTSVKSFSNYVISYDIKNNENEEILVLLESSSHAIATSSSNLSYYNNIVKIKLVDGSTIPYEANWIPYAREIYTIFNELQTKYKKIIIAHAMHQNL